MTLYTMGSFCPYIECAPCPPYFVVDIYQILVNVSLSVNLTETDYRAIAKRCNIAEPTTTTTTTSTISTTRTSSAQQTTSIISTTDIMNVANKSATTITQSSSSSTQVPVNVSDASGISSTKHIPISKINFTSSTSGQDLPTSLSTKVSSSTATPTSMTEITGLTTGGSKQRHRWPYCNDVCLIIAITLSTCAFLVLMVVLALCCRRNHPPNKGNIRSSSSQRLVANGTSERPSTQDHYDGIVWRHNPGIENLAYRKSLEMREPLKYMDSEQNWEDLDYVAAGKDGSLRSNKSSQRGDGSPKRKKRSSRDKRQSSTEKLNQTHGLTLIPLSDIKQRSLPKVPGEENEHSYPNGIKFLSLPRPPKERYANYQNREHIRSNSDGQGRSRTKQRPRSHEHLNTHLENVYVDIQEYPRQSDLKNSTPNRIKNDLKSKDTNLIQAHNRKLNNSPRHSTQPDHRNPTNHKQGQNISNATGPNVRRFHPEDTVFPAVDSSSSQKFYPPYRDSNKQTVMFTTRL